ncbi:carbonic anhydrase [Linnemannia elongata AG-77]|uniref:carbonic anhydrase n=1 Tax=Linnemannia elongata AG-77 TaxID=1314771 RepID=A0A197K0C5_9FUNG|nr:carbonic anhydrase [Linnemannia elongata AG-77]
MKFILSVVIATSSLFAAVSAHAIVKRAPPAGPHWDYSGDKTGPDHWGLLDPAYVTCESGMQQSPVDINKESLSRFVHCAKKALTFDYKPVKDAVAHFNGHTVEIDWTPGAKTHNNSIAIGKKQYNLIQFHFHTPSEHRINGRHADAELHLVHRNPVDKSLAVIGVLLQAQARNVPFFHYLTALQKKVHADKHSAVAAAPGTTSAIIEELLKDSVCAGTQPTSEEATKVDYPLPSVDFEPLVRALKGFTPRWEYSGSLTTPPCSENVAWNVMHDPYPIGLDQLRALVDLQGYNARDIEDSRGGSSHK